MKRTNILAVIIILIVIIISFFFYLPFYLLRDKESSRMIKFVKQGGSEDIIKMIKNNNKCINDKNERNETPLGWAIAKKNKIIAEILINNGAKINEKCWGKTPLCIATTKNDFDLVKLLIKSKADVNILDEMGRTPLINSCMDNNQDIATFLLNNGADKEIKDLFGMTALDYAKKYNYEKIVQLLVDCEETGADSGGETGADMRN